MLSLKELTINVQFTIYQKKIYKQDKAGVGGRIVYYNKENEAIKSESII